MEGPYIRDPFMDGSIIISSNDVDQWPLGIKGPTTAGHGLINNGESNRPTLGAG